MPMLRVRAAAAAAAAALLAAAARGARHDLLARAAVPVVDFAAHGHLALAGSFAGISTYDYPAQSAQAHARGSLFLQLPNGAFALVGEADGSINALCALSPTTYLVGGQFSTIGGVAATNLATWDPQNRSFAPLDQHISLAGSIDALYCSNVSNSAYIGGGFELKNTSNAVTWSPDHGFVDLPFGGFNGPVHTIKPLADGAIYFGGDFDALGLGSSHYSKEQLVNLASSQLSATNPSPLQEFANAKNIICPDGTEGNQKTLLFADHMPGTWISSSDYYYRPTRIRIHNTHYQGRGTKVFRFTAMPINGILNLTYIDPLTRNLKACDAECPLSDDPKIPYQDFIFVNVIGISGFRLDVSAWYGNGAGLNGIELFTDDSVVYAVESFNEPSCNSDGLVRSSSVLKGDWTFQQGLPITSSGFLSASLKGNQLKDASVAFQPAVPAIGNYSIQLFTPGCTNDNTCPSRGRVNVTVLSAPDEFTSSVIYQTNEFDKYDPIYTGILQRASTKFTPQVVVQPADGQESIYMVVQKIQVFPISTLVGLNGSFVYDPASKLEDIFNFDPLNFTPPPPTPKLTAANFTMPGSDHLPFIAGNITSSLKTKNGTVYLAGSINGTQEYSAHCVASLVEVDDKVKLDDNYLNLFGNRAQQSPKFSLLTHPPFSDPDDVVYHGLYYKHADRNELVIGGHFTYKDANRNRSVSNLAFVSPTNVTGLNRHDLDTERTSFYALHIRNETLFAGGNITGRIGSTAIGGLMLWDLDKAEFNPIQPPALQGHNMSVNVISSRPKSAQVIVGGKFETAGSLPCPSLCIYDTTNHQWNRPGLGIAGSVSSIAFTGGNTLAVAGNVSLDGNFTYYLQYDFSTSIWSAPAVFPGPVSTMLVDNSESQIFASGTFSSNLTNWFGMWSGSQFSHLDSGLSPDSVINDITFLQLAKKHEKNNVLAANRVLLVAGELIIDGEDACSAALFDGQTWTPYILTSKVDGHPGTIYTLFSEYALDFASSLVAISFGISLVLTMLLVGIGVLLGYLIRKRQGYSKGSNRTLSQIPPESLFGNGPVLPTLNPLGSGAEYNETIRKSMRYPLS